tara:strand:+ start:12403 stop:13182 length:780 start_codon:yes stop_codon:yes gene_type:complete
MQTIQRYLLNQLVIGYISGYHGRNSKVYDRRLTLHRGVSNPVSFTFKNEDQKPQDISSKKYTLNVVDTESKKNALTKSLTILDDGSTISLRGTANCTITDGDLLQLDAKFYNFSVSDVTDANNPQVTYSDTGYVAAGTIEVLDGAYAQFVDSTSISAFTLSGDVFTSGAISGRPGINNNTALHTIAIYPKNFSGTVTVQGTMETDPSSDDDYFDITSSTLSSASSVSTLNFTGVYQNVRFKADRTADTTGRIDKILYRQ